MFTGLCGGGLMVHRITYMTKRPPPVSAKQVNAANTSVFHTSKPIALSNLEKKKKKDHRPLQLLNAIFHYSDHASASNRTLLEKISGVCITLISLHINISQFRLKNAFVFFEEKGIWCPALQHTRPRLQAPEVDSLYVASWKRDSCDKALWRLSRRSRVLANNVKHAHD